MKCTPSIVMLLAMAFGGSLIARQSNLGTVQLAIEGRANATPWVAARGPFVAVVWGATATGGGTDVYLAVSRDGAGIFDSPVRVNSRPGTARLGGELPPRVALSRVQPGSPEPSITVVWGSREATTEIRSARSILPSLQIMSCLLYLALPAANRGGAPKRPDWGNMAAAIAQHHDPDQIASFS